MDRHSFSAIIVSRDGHYVLLMHGISSGAALFTENALLDYVVYIVTKRPLGAHLLDMYINLGSAFISRYLYKDCFIKQFTLM